jgi:hypothetical protein
MAPNGESSGRERGYGLLRPLQCTNLYGMCSLRLGYTYIKQLAEVELTGDYPLLFFLVFPNSFQHPSLFLPLKSSICSLLLKRFLPIFYHFLFLSFCSTRLSESLLFSCFSPLLYKVFPLPLVIDLLFPLFISSFFVFFLVAPFLRAPSPLPPLFSPPPPLCCCFPVLLIPPLCGCSPVLLIPPPHLLSVAPQQSSLPRAFHAVFINSVDDTEVFYLDVYRTIS